MKAYLKRQIRRKLQNYRVPLNSVDTSLPKQLNAKKRVAVVGGGIAGISATSNLAERGFEVTLFEKDSYLGGKVGSWSFESNGEQLQVEHGFHAFFRQYYNLRAFMQKIGSYQHLRPIDDYLILLADGGSLGFKDIEKTPGLNVLDLRKRGVFNWLTFISPFSMPFLHLLRYDQEKTFRGFDNESFESYARRTLMPKRMRLVFNTFARAFFSEPDKMSMAELIKGFHFYFLSNEDGLLYDVLDDDFKTTFLDPCQQYMEKHGATIKLNTPVECIQQRPNGFVVNDEEFDYLVLCTDVKHILPLLNNSPSLQQFSAFNKSVGNLKPSDRYAVLRVWTDRFEQNPDWPFFIFTDRLQALDSITLYHKMEKSSADWSQRNQGGIFELHSYALPDDLTDDKTIRETLLEELYHYMPELRGMTIKHEYLQHRHDFPAFHTGLNATRPRIETTVPNLFLAGDWVKMDNTTMLMEAAYTSGAIAANHILTQEGLQQNLLESVPGRGVLA